jgi:hypothetical protein
MDRQPSSLQKSFPSTGAAAAPEVPMTEPRIAAVSAIADFFSFSSSTGPLRAIR